MVLLILPFLFLTLLIPGVENKSLEEEPAIVRVRILDDANQMTAARVRFTGPDGTYYAPEGSLADFPVTSANDPQGKEQGLILDDGRKFSYVDGAFDIALPAEKITIEVVKGFRYQVYQDTIDLELGQSNLEIRLHPVYPWPQSGWYSGDVHVHYIDPETALLQMKAEDLNVCNVLISDFTIDHQSFRGAVEPLSEPEHIVYLGQEYREDRLGHINLLNLKTKLIEPAATPRRYHYPLNIHASDQVHRDGGHVSWAHFAAWPGLEGPLGLVLKKVDAVELLCTIDPFHQPIFAPDVVPEIRMNSGLRLWYRLLNCGLTIPATAGTDKMNNQVSAGANRVFVQVDQPLTYDRWIEAINAGRTFISNNPFLLLEIDGQGPGSIIRQEDGKNHTIRAEVWTQFPVDRLEIIANGEMIAEKQLAPGETHASLEISLSPEKSLWIAARAYQFSHPYTRRGLSLAQRRDEADGTTLLNRYFGTLRPETVFAHTSPAYITVDDWSVYSPDDAAYFIRYLENSKRWLDESGSFPDEQTRNEVLNAFQQGIQAFRELDKGK